MLALDAAAGGSICLRARRLPKDFDRLCRFLRESPRAAIVFVCLQHHDHDRVRDLLCRPLEIPRSPGGPRSPSSSSKNRLTRLNLSQAAELLRMAPVSLARWSSRRPWLTAILQGLETPSARADN